MMFVKEESNSKTLQISEGTDYLIVHSDSYTTQRIIEQACNTIKKKFKHGHFNISPQEWVKMFSNYGSSETEEEKEKTELEQISNIISDTSELIIQMCVTYTIMSHEDDGFRINFYVSYTEDNEPKITEKLAKDDPKLLEVCGIDPKQHKSCKCEITRDMTEAEVECATQLFTTLCSYTILGLAKQAS